ncbi:adenylate/guanylate cyclase domain-containing protein [Bradyrhizobium sp. Ai1a-2]|uniref:adenylate/guanylate cyclase domain-containing protein n=1 Tax=Bradyrhizobium sp. Ai1a-2 TaxID=196490 RepID=UPI0003FE3520|nr:adenylate/guanylate cyclase domain-containing protein [Bradyrhizobium sp. Ai1a-2]
MSHLELPETRYALSDDISIAYQVTGDGPVDIVMVPGLFSHVEFMHELPGYTAFLRRLSRFARVVSLDKRGQGLSDRMTDAPSLETRMDDVRAVMDAVGSRRAVLFGFSEGCPMSALFAATYPGRVSHLILVGGYSRAADRIPDELWPARLEHLIKAFGSGEMIKTVTASQASSADAVRQFARLERLSSSPGAMRTLLMLNRQIDVTSVLPDLRVPTLVLHRKMDIQVPVALSRRLSEQIPGARYVEYADGDHSFWTGDVEALHGDIEEFVTGHRGASSAELERVLATVLFTDIVDSTRSAAAMGDERWRRVLDEHDRLAEEVVGRHRGNLVKSTGDGILATFDGPGRAVRCALAIGVAARKIGLPLRAGLHTGEIEIRGRDIGGIAVHAAARVMAQSGPDEVLVSRVVTDLVAGAGLKFKERGSFDLKGLPGKWDVYAATA